METGSTNTSVEANETVNAAPQDEVNAQIEEVIEKYTIDDLMNITEEDDPLFGSETNHKGMKPINHWLPHVPEDVRKHLANLRADYTRKSQEIADARRELQRAQAALEQQRQNLVNGSLAQQVANIDTETKYDLFDEAGMQAEIKRQAALMMKEMLQPAQEELQQQARRLQLQDFKAANPELTDPAYRDEIVKLLQSRPELKLEDAFYITKAKLGSIAVDREAQALAERRQRQRETVLKSSGGTRSAPKGTPKFNNALEAYKWHKANQGK